MNKPASTPPDPPTTQPSTEGASPRRVNPLAHDPERARLYAEYAREHLQAVQDLSNRLAGRAERIITTAGALAAFAAVFVPKDQLESPRESIVVLAAFGLLAIALLVGIYALRIRKQVGYPEVFDMQIGFSDPLLSFARLDQQRGNALLSAANSAIALNEQRARLLIVATAALLAALLLLIVRLLGFG
jgi:hypothetical protein